MKLLNEQATHGNCQSRYVIIVDLKLNSYYEPMPYEIMKVLREANPCMLWPSSLNEDWCLAITKWDVHQYTPYQAH